jgi:gas vesicle protein
LAAPTSGEELRGKIQGEVQRIQDEMKLAADTKRAELEAQLADLKAPRKPPSSD